MSALTFKKNGQGIRVSLFSLNSEFNSFHQKRIWQQSCVVCTDVFSRYFRVKLWNFL